MTINVAVATFDAVVLGCDSLSSMMQPMLPLAKARPAIGSDGKPAVDGKGNLMLALDPTAFDNYPVNVFGGVSKMFLLYEDKDTSVAAVTAGQGTVNGRTIAGLAEDFQRINQAAKTKSSFASVEDVAKAFLRFMHDEWVKQPHLKELPPEVVQRLGTVTFILGGYGKSDAHGRVYKLDVAKEHLEEAFKKDKHYSGVTWAGQSNFVERLMKGADGQLEPLVTRNILEALNAQRSNVVSAILNGLRENGVEIPPDIKFQFREVIPPSDPWTKFWADIDYKNLPVQYAIDLASLLVNTQSGMQHFSSGIATVGGRTHIGVLQKNKSFRKLKEPKLSHSHTGYSHE